MNIKLIIPARYHSTRFPGKPLVNLKGKSMIRRVWDRAKLGFNKKNIYIATDSKKILNHCLEFTMNTILTSDKCLTGTDRVAECARKIDADVFVNIQGDEPLISPYDIKRLINQIKKNPDTVFNFMKKIESDLEYKSKDIPKVITDRKNNLLFMSRLPVPISDNYKQAYKQVCIYSFPKKILKFYGLNKKKTKNEVLENIEILRLLDNGVNVKMIKTVNKSYAIDRKEDIKKVLKLIT